jgi:hypothetical protein
MKGWLSWIDFNKGTEFYSSIIDFIFDLVSGRDGSKAGRWFRDLESKDGHEPGNSFADKPSPTGLAKHSDKQGVLPIKVIK